MQSVADLSKFSPVNYRPHAKMKNVSRTNLNLLINKMLSSNKLGFIDVNQTVCNGNA